MQSMHEHTNTCSWYIKKNIRENPNLACLKTNKQSSKETKTQKHKRCQKKGILCERNKETKVKNSNNKYACTYIGLRT